MKKIALTITAACFAFISQAQFIKAEGGISLSKLKTEFLNTTNKSDWYQGQSFFLGVDYLNVAIINLSSNIGYVRKGGMDKDSDTKSTLDYLSLNTRLELNSPTPIFKPFISFGPRVDYMINHSEDFDPIDDADKLNKLTTGAVAGFGFKIKVPKLICGIRGDYYYNFNKIIDSDGLTTNDNTFVFNLFAGIKL